jgi:saccharopine dehydrogenase (NAD+, L-lysine-forming)
MTAGLAVDMCDTLRSTTNPHNPIPIYPPVNTSFPEPTVEVKVGEGNPRMTVIAIDHLPTLVSILSLLVSLHSSADRITWQSFPLF